jgi:AraC family transcriptional regulator
MTQTHITQVTKTIYPFSDGISPIASSQSQDWKSIIVEEFQQPPGKKQYHYSEEHAIYLCLANHPYQLQQIKGTKRHVSPLSKGDISITPAEIPCLCQSDGKDHYLQIRIGVQFLQQVAREANELDVSYVELLPKFRVRDSQIEQIGMMLYGELKTGGLAGQLYVDSLANVLVVHLLRNYSTARTCVDLHEGKLNSYQLLEVTDYINEHLAQDIKLADLAQLLRMSQFHFCRLFKQSIGKTPHQYLIQQRVERSKQLLQRQDIAIGDVALQCGFNSHSHLGKWFRKLIGITPKSYRQVVSIPAAPE